MKKIIGVLVMIVMAVVTLAVAIFSISTPNGEKRWDLFERIGGLLNILKPTTLLAAFAAIIPTILLSTAAINASDSDHDPTAHHGLRRFLRIATILTIVLGALAFLKTTFGGGGEEQQREHAVDETVSDEHAGADETATAPA